MVTAANQFFDIVELDLAWTLVMARIQEEFTAQTFNPQIWAILHFSLDNLSICDNDAMPFHLPMLLLGIISEFYLIRSHVDVLLEHPGFLLGSLAVGERLGRLLLKPTPGTAAAPSSDRVKKDWSAGEAAALARSFADEPNTNWAPFDTVTLLRGAFVCLLDVLPLFLSKMLHDGRENCELLKLLLDCTFNLAALNLPYHDPTLVQSISDWLSSACRLSLSVNDFAPLNLTLVHIGDLMSLYPDLTEPKLGQLFSQVVILLNFI